MFNKEKVLIMILFCLAGFISGVWIAYPRGQESRQTQINTLQEKLLLCNATTNNLEIRKIKGNGTTDIIQKLSKENAYNPYVFGCKQDTAGIIKYFCELPYKKRRKIEKNLD